MCSYVWKAARIVRAAFFVSFLPEIGSLLSLQTFESMGKKKEQAVVDVVINNEQARRKVAELSADFDALRKRKREALKAGNTAEANSLDKEIKTLQKEMNQYKKSVVDVDHVLRNLNKVPLNQLEAAQRNLRKNLKLLDQNSKEYKATLEKLNRVQKQIDTTQKQMQTSGKGFMGSFGSLMPLGIMGIIYALKQLTIPFTNFQYMMAKVGAVSNATSTQFKALKEDAKALGASTEYTATQVAELQLNYARLGFTPNQILQITSATLDLATATGSDLAASADVAGSTLKAFNYDASQMPRVVDVMANSFNKSALQLNYFAESMKYVAPIAAKANVSLEQTTAMLGILADRGIRGSQAGTALKRILSEIELSGKSVSEALADLNEKGLTLADAEDEVGKYAMTALTVLADNAPAVENLTAALDDSAGAAQRAAAIMRDNIKGDVDEFTSKLEGLAIQLGDKLNPVIRGTIQLFTRLLTPLSVVAVAMVSWFITLKTTRAAVEAYNVAKRRFILGTKDSTVALISETAAMNVNTIAAKRNLIAIRNMPAATKAWAAAKLLLAGNLRAAAVAARMFIASIGPIGVIATVVGLAVGAVAMFSGESKKAADASSQLALELSQERSTYEGLKKVVLESAVGSKARAEAIRQINERYKDYLPNLLAEKMSNEEIATALDEVNQKMEENIKSKIRAQEAQRITQELLDAEKTAIENILDDGQRWNKLSEEQAAIVRAMLADMIIQAQQGKIEIAQVNELAAQFGFNLEKIRGTSSDNRESKFFRNILRQLQNVADQAKEGAAALRTIDNLINHIADSESQYSTMTLDQLNVRLSTVNSKLAMKNTLTKEQRAAAEAERDEILKQIQALDQQARGVENYADTLKRLKAEKEKLEDQLNRTDGTNKKEIARIQALIAAKQKEIDLYSNKKTTGSSGAKWSVTSDESYLKAKADLRERQMKGDIATEEEYSRQLLALEIKTLEDRIAANKEKGADLAKLEEQLLDKRYQRQKAARDREKKLLEIAAQGDSAEDKENDAYEKQLRAHGLFGRKLEEMTANEQAAYLQLKRLHYEKLSAIYVDELSKEISSQQKAIQRKATALKQSHNDELATATTFEQKKALLAQWYSASELRRIKTDKQADQALQKHYAAEEQAEMKKSLEAMLATYQAIADEVGETGLLSNGVAATEEDIERLQKIIDDLQNQLAELGATPKPTLGGEDKDTKKSDVDILGMTRDQWDEMFENLKESEDRAGAIGGAIAAFGGAFSEAFGKVGTLMTAMEQRELKNFEKSQNQKKKLLERQLKAGTLSQERYNESVQRLDEQTDAKREEMERKQAKREKLQAVFNSLINTAVAVTASLPNIPLAITVGALGAVETAAILATPLPGAETGGMIVERQQDGKQYRAGYEPDRRGPVTRPTVLVGENGTEYVVPAEGYENPTIRPVLDIMERARRSGTIREINLPAALAASGVIPGRASGGYVGNGTAANAGSSVSDAAISLGSELWSEVTTTLRENREVMGKLSRQLEKPIATYISYLGRDGIATIQKKLEQQQRRSGIGGK